MRVENDWMICKCWNIPHASTVLTQYHHQDQNMRNAWRRQRHLVSLCHCREYRLEMRTVMHENLDAFFALRNILGPQLHLCTWAGQKHVQNIFTILSSTHSTVKQNLQDHGSWPLWYMCAEIYGTRRSMGKKAGSTLQIESHVANPPASKHALSICQHQSCFWKISEVSILFVWLASYLWSYTQTGKIRGSLPFVWLFVAWALRIDTLRLCLQFCFQNIFFLMSTWRIKLLTIQ